MSMQRPQGSRLAGMQLLLAILAACGGSDVDPDALPWRLVQERVLHHDSRAVDLDGDGRDELYFTYAPSGGQAGLEAFVLESQTNGVIDQVNFTGDVGEPHFHDLNGDGLHEALVPVVRGDSLFLTAVAPDGAKMFSVFITSGAPRVEPDGVIPWHAKILALAVHDFEGDGIRELVTVVATGYARLPRGVFLHRLPGGELLGEIILGAGLHSAMIRDFDGDGTPQAFALAMASDNGARAGGFDDSRPYAIAFDLWPAPAVRWFRELPSSAEFASMWSYDDDGDGVDEILLLGNGRGGGLMELIDTRSWRTLRSRTIEAQVGRGVALDLTRDRRPEIVFPAVPDRVLQFDDRFDLQRSARLAGLLWVTYVAPDLDGDGIDEIGVATGGGTLSDVTLLDERLRPKARIPGGYPVTILRRGGSTPPGLIVHEGARRSDPERSVLYDLVPNRFYLVHRYGRGVGWTAAGLGVLLITAGSFRLVRNKRVLELVAAGDDGAGVLLTDAAGRIRWMNRTLARWIDLDGHRPANLEALAMHAGERGAPLIRFARDAMASDPPRPARTGRALSAGEKAPPLRGVAEPVVTGLRGDPHWLIRFQDVSNGDGLGAEWEPLARRLMHDLRNPLTSMLLTLQRLQMEYRERAPEAAPALDPYARRIQDRADQLRRMTTGFLKLVGAEHAPLDDVDPNALVRAGAEAIGRGLPPDIALELRLTEPLPRIAADREQLESVLENLVANAVNAMPAGGTVTLATGLARGLQIGGGGATADCVQIEVLDTGDGIPADVIERMFEPGFSTREDGSGLGLAIVRRIVASHAGEVHVESEPGVGTAFTILLPVRPPDREPRHV